MNTTPSSTRTWLAAIAAIAAITAISSAQTASAAWSEHGTLTTPHGTYSASRSGSCGGGSCSRTASVTGPNGRTVAYSGSVAVAAPRLVGPVPVGPGVVVGASVAVAPRVVVAAPVASIVAVAPVVVVPTPVSPAVLELAVPAYAPPAVGVNLHVWAH